MLFTLIDAFRLQTKYVSLWSESIKCSIIFTVSICYHFHDFFLFGYFVGVKVSYYFFEVFVRVKRQFFFEFVKYCLWFFGLFTYDVHQGRIQDFFLGGGGYKFFVLFSNHDHCFRSLFILASWFLKNRGVWPPNPPEYASDVHQKMVF